MEKKQIHALMTALDRAGFTPERANLGSHEIEIASAGDFNDAARQLAAVIEPCLFVTVSGRQKPLKVWLTPELDHDAHSGLDRVIQTLKVTS